MNAIDALVEADRLVIAGLHAYDEITGRVLAGRKAELVAAGFDEAGVSEFMAGVAETVRRDRGELHRSLWLKFITMLFVPSKQAAGGDQ